MGRPKKLEWKQWIRNYGTKNLARELDCERATVNRWLNKGDLPKDDFKRQIVVLSKGGLTFNNFYV